MKPEIVIIAAVGARNRLIGNGLKLPWHIPEDLRRFKRLTLGHPLLMGRRTFQSLVEQFGGPLPGRRNIVISGSGRFKAPSGIEVYDSVDDALEAVADASCVFVGGGAMIYEHFLPVADRMELTLVDGDHVGDVYFPAYEHLVGPVYEIRETEEHEDFRFVTFVRRPDSLAVSPDLPG